MKKKSELEKKIEALPDNVKAARKWTYEEDAAILNYSGTKGSEALGRILGISGLSVRRRLAFLKLKTKN